MSGLSSPLTSLSSLDDNETSKLPSKSQSSSFADAESRSELDLDPGMMDAVKVHISGVFVSLMLIVTSQLLIACRTAFVHRTDKDCMSVDPGPSDRNHVAIQTEPEECVKFDMKDAKPLKDVSIHLVSATAPIDIACRLIVPNHPREAALTRSRTHTKRELQIF